MRSMQMRPRESDSSSSASYTSSSTSPSLGFVREVSPSIAKVNNTSLTSTSSPGANGEDKTNANASNNEATTNVPNVLQLPQSNHVNRNTITNASNIIPIPSQQHQKESKNKKEESEESKSGGSRERSERNNRSSSEKNLESKESSRSQSNSPPHECNEENANQANHSIQTHNNINNVINNDQDDAQHIKIDSTAQDNNHNNVLTEMSREQLIDKCKMYEEWNDRLQGQLAELIQLSQNSNENENDNNKKTSLESAKQLAALRSKMYKSEIALPLLQCYDAAIAVEAENNAVLSHKLEVMENECNAAKHDKKELQRALELAEQLTHQVEKHSLMEIDKLEKNLHDAQSEISQLQNELKYALEGANGNKFKESNYTKEQLQSKQTIAELTKEKELLEHEIAVCKNSAQLQMSKTAEGNTEMMQQRVELQLLRKENDNLQQEVNSVRESMVQALQQSAANHTKHLELVQSKHNTIIDQFKAATKTKELELVKLRTQLSYYQLQIGTSTNNSLARTIYGCGSTSSSSNNNAVNSPSSCTNTNDVNNGASGHYAQSQQNERTFQLLATHAREQLEQQIKYLYKQLHDISNEKNEVEESSQVALANLQKETKAQAAMHAEELASLTNQIEEQKKKNNIISNEYAHLQEDFTKMTEKLKTCQAQLAEVQQSNASLQNNMSQSSEQLEKVTNKLKQTQTESEHAIELEKVKVKQLEERVQHIIDTELEQAKRDAQSNICSVRREQEMLEEQVHNLERAVEVKEVQVVELQRGKAALERQLQHMRDCTLPQYESEAHELNRKIANSNERLHSALAQIQTLTLDKEQLQWELERNAKRSQIKRNKNYNSMYFVE